MEASDRESTNKITQNLQQAIDSEICTQCGQYREVCAYDAGRVQRQRCRNGHKNDRRETLKNLAR